MVDLKTQEENEAFYSLERKLTEKLIKEEMIKSFKEISEYDRIEITNQNHTSIKNTDFKTLNTKWDMYIPFIRNGVMIIFGHSDRVVYNHFMIKSINATSGIIELCMDIYTNTNGYYSKLMDFDCTLTDINDKIKCHYKNIKYSFNYYEELIHDELIKLTKDELKLYKDYSHEFFNNIKKEYKTNKNYYDKIMKTFLDCFVYLNNCIEMEKQDKRATKTIKTKSDHHVTIVQDSNTIDIARQEEPITQDKIIIIHGIKIKKGVRESSLKTRQGVLVINRKTQIWEVTGHWRHYKSGKTIYIEPFKKGPGRDKEDHSRKIYKLKTESQEINEEVKTNDRKN